MRVVKRFSFAGSVMNFQERFGTTLNRDFPSPLQLHLSRRLDINLIFHCIFRSPNAVGLSQELLANPMLLGKFPEFNKLGSFDFLRLFALLVDSDQEVIGMFTSRRR